MEKRLGNVPAQQLISELENPEQGRKIFLLQGKAGTGKSTLTNDLINKYTDDVAPIVLGSTGIAAINVGGKTVHSFFGLGINDPDPMVEGSNSIKPEKAHLIASAPFIVIDEVSMLHANVIDTIDMMLRTAMVVYYNDGQYENLPFGGKTMLFVGDMFQLPPVVTDSWEKKFGKNKLISDYQSAFFFDSNVFKSNSDKISVIELQKNYRQGNDKHFSEMLDKIRENRQTYQDIAVINSRLNKEIDKNAIVLTTTNKNANRINSLKLAKIFDHPLHVFKPNQGGEYPGNMIPHDGDLHLKIGAQVMMINNDMTERWVNGSIGTVVEINTEEDRVMVNIDGTVHSVGRHRRENIDEIATPVYDDKGEPVINKKGKHKMSVKLDMIGRYIQYPMKLAWAITIHKSQGQTFKDVKIDLEWGAFADAQTYVALSRCESLEGISLVQPIKPKDIRVNDRVLSYYLSNKNYIEV